MWMQGSQRLGETIFDLKKKLRTSYERERKYCNVNEPNGSGPETCSLAKCTCNFSLDEKFHIFIPPSSVNSFLARHARDVKTSLLSIYDSTEKLTEFPSKSIFVKSDERARELAWGSSAGKEGQGTAAYINCSGLSLSSRNNQREKFTESLHAFFTFLWKTCSATRSPLADDGAREQALRTGW